MSGISIGKASERSGCTVAAIRHYEEIGLLSSVSRASNGRRVYGWPDIHRLRFIRRCRDLGFGLDEVRSLIGGLDGGAPDCLAVRDLALAHVERLQAMRSEIEVLERALSSIAATCSKACAGGRSPACRIVDDLGATASG
jgi:MerR family transcriptional regulator, copper efflux regulator